ncbi:MAG: hypothetical protein ACRDTG_07235 [Pseudonocardiaceae bacterium]
MIDTCTLTLGSFFADDMQRAAFVTRFTDFSAADYYLPQIANLSSGILRYVSESFIPPEPSSNKSNLFFVVGNPAPESVGRGSMYAYEGAGTRQHRFWKVLHSTGILRFSERDPDVYSPEEKMLRLFAGDYMSPFNVHIIPFFSLPSPPGGAWGGVIGLRRLFGRGFAQLVSAEHEVVRQLIEVRAQDGDCVLVLQKDAYVAMKPASAPDYNISVLRTAPLTSHYGRAGIKLMCMPPTRLFYSQVTRTALLSLVGQSTR